MQAIGNFVHSDTGMKVIVTGVLIIGAVAGAILAAHFIAPVAATIIAASLIGAVVGLCLGFPCYMLFQSVFPAPPVPLGEPAAD